MTAVPSKGGGFVTISKENYELLVRDSCELDALKSIGVDNWSGWGEHAEYRDKMIEAYLGKKDKQNVTN